MEILMTIPQRFAGEGLGEAGGAGEERERWREEREDLGGAERESWREKREDFGGAGGAGGRGQKLSHGPTVRVREKLGGPAEWER